MEDIKIIGHLPPLPLHDMRGQLPMMYLPLLTASNPETKEEYRITLATNASALYLSTEAGTQEALKFRDLVNAWIEQFQNRLKREVMEADTQLYPDTLYWGIEDYATAEDEGWNLFNLGSDTTPTLERDDDSTAFSSDTEALEHVIAKAKAGSLLHLRALAIMGADRLYGE